MTITIKQVFDPGYKQYYWIAEYDCAAKSICRAKTFQELAALIVVGLAQGQEITIKRL